MPEASSIHHHWKKVDRVTAILLLVISELCVQLPVSQGYANKVGCSTSLSNGGHRPSRQTAAGGGSATLARGGLSLSCGSQLTAGEALTVLLSGMSGEYLVEVTGATMSGGSCSGTRMLSGGGSVTVPASGTVTVQASYGGDGHSQVYTSPLCSYSVATAVPCTACAANTYQVSGCTSTSNRVCASCATRTCPLGQFLSGCGSGSPPSAGSCVACSSTCPPKTFRTAICTATSDLVCSPCHGCDINYYVSQPCSETSDAACALCSTCPAGQYASSPCTGSSNTVCTACATGQFLLNG